MVSKWVILHNSTHFRGGYGENMRPKFFGFFSILNKNFIHKKCSSHGNMGATVAVSWLEPE